MKMKFSPKFPASAFGLVLAFAFFTTAQAQISVCPTGCDHDSIQDAIDAANPGDVIEVQPGTYEEVLEIVEKENITIQGDHRSNTTIRALNADLVNWPAYHQSSTRKTAVLIDRSEDIHISGFTFDFDNVGTGGGDTGLMMWNSTGSFEENAFINRGIQGQQVDVNAYVGADETTIYNDNNRADVLFKNNEFENTGRIGLNVQNFVFLTIENNSFEKTFDDPGYGIEMASLSNGVISNNTFNNFNIYFTDGSASSAIYIHNNFTDIFTDPFVKQVDVHNNSIDNCIYGLYIGSTSGGTHWNWMGNVSIESTVSGNNITNSELAGVFVTDDGASLGSGITANFQNNVIDGGEYGYNLNTYWGDGSLDVSISNDDIRNADIGVKVIDFNDHYNDPSDSEYNISVNQTSIVGYTSFAIRNQYDQITVVADCNWYDTNLYSEIEDAISGEVVFVPFLEENPDGNTFSWSGTDTYSCTGETPIVIVDSDGNTYYYTDLEDALDDLPASDGTPGSGGLLKFTDEDTGEVTYFIKDETGTVFQLIPTEDAMGNPGPSGLWIPTIYGPTPQ